MDKESHSEFEDVRQRFDALDVEEQASFLVEATASTLARGVQEIGATLAEGIEDVVRQARQTSSSSGSGRPGAAESETAQTQTPRSGSRNAGSPS